MPLVIDASFTLAVLLEEDAAATAPIEAIVVARGAIAPPIWRLEVANSVISAIRRKRLRADRAPALFRSLDEANVVIDDASIELAWTATFELALRHRLTVYDASYLELATRQHLAIATFDGELAEAARSDGVVVFGA